MLQKISHEEYFVCLNVTAGCIFDDDSERKESDELVLLSILLLIILFII